VRLPQRGRNCYGDAAAHPAGPTTLRRIADRGDDAEIRATPARRYPMCQLCEERSIEVEELENEDEEVQCEWMSEEEGPGSCERSAAYAVSEWYVEDHLCQAHAEEFARDLEEGLSDLLEATGLGSEQELRPIGPGELCEHTPPLPSGEWKPCRRAAAYAKYVLTTWLVCPEHAAAMQAEAERE
jgi:hypothetical protein